MAFDYTTLFTDLGKIIKYINSYQTFTGTTLPTDRDAIATELAGFLKVTSQLQSLYDGQQNSLVSLRQRLGGLISLRLQDQTTVIDALSLLSSDVTGIMRALYRQMGLDSQTIKRSTVTVGSPSYAAANAGNGKVYASKVLDGVTAPGAGMPANILYNGVDSELTVPTETITLICTADSEMDGRQDGAESWSFGGGQSYPKLGWQTEGSGQGPGLTTFNQSSLIANKDFESWSSNTPGSWTISAGSGQVTKESTTIYRGTYALKFAGNASALLTMTQAVNPSRLTARKRYLLSIAVKASSVPAAGNLVVKFTGTGYTAASSEKIDIVAGSLPTSWTLYQCWINLPTVLPSDWALSITVTGPLSNTVNLFLDSISFAPAVYHGGVCLGVVAGSTAWLRGDRVTFTLANDGAGVFQTFFRRWFGMQLPSVGGGTHTIADTLAT